MGQTTEIAWCDSTCNPVVGCDGCELHREGDSESYCYAARLVGRYAGLLGWPASFDRPELFPERIKRALAWPDLTGRERPDKPWLNGRPRHIFWCDLSDPFTESIPLDWLVPYLPMLADSPHIHIFCTKRPARAREFFEQHRAPRNLILLTTVTSQPTIWRVRTLLMIPGISVPGLSLEPMLGPVDLDKHDWLFDRVDTGGNFEMTKSRRLNWVILGGESGPGARPCDVAWIRSVVRQCRAARVPVFVKQVGSFPIIAACRQNHYDWGDEIGRKARFFATDKLHPSTEAWRIHLKDRKGGDPSEWAEEFRVRQMPAEKLTGAEVKR